MKAFAVVLAVVATILSGSSKAAYCQSYAWTTIAGQAGAIGSADGTSSNARFYNPSGIAVDRVGNVYVADTRNFTLRKISPSGQNWVITTIVGRANQVGSTDGTNNDARFNRPNAIALDSNGTLYVVDHYNHTIRQISPSGDNWVVTTIAGLPGTSGSDDGINGDARFSAPTGIARHDSGTLFITDTVNNTIRAVTPDGGNSVVTTLAGFTDLYGGFTDGLGADARFWFPAFIAVDSATNLFVADSGNNAIRQITPLGSDWMVTTIAGWTNSGTVDGEGTEARFSFPNGIAVDDAGHLYVADQDNHTIRKLSWDGTNWVTSTIGGLAGEFGSADGVGTEARFRRPWGIAVDHSMNLYVADFGNQTIRKGAPSIVSAPALEIAKLGTEVALSWSALGSNYVLETADALLPGAVWDPVTNTPTILEGRLVISNAPGPVPAFYRLRRLAEDAQR